MVAKRRDGEGKISLGPTWESIVERQIREAMEDGAFDELPYQGVPIPLDDDSAAGERALGFRVLRNAGVAPPWIEADKEVRDLLAAAGRAAGAGGCRGHVAAGPRTVAPWVRAPRRGGEPRDRAAQRRGADGSPASTAAGSRGGTGAAGGGVRRLTPPPGRCARTADGRYVHPMHRLRLGPAWRSALHHMHTSASNAREQLTDVHATHELGRNGTVVPISCASHA